MMRGHWQLVTLARLESEADGLMDKGIRSQGEAKENVTCMKRSEKLGLLQRPLETSFLPNSVATAIGKSIDTTSQLHCSDSRGSAESAGFP
jgi:hypothetical protein